MEYINDMQRFVSGLEVKVIRKQYNSDYEYQFYQNIQFCYIHNEKEAGQLINQYLYEVGWLLQKNLNPQA